MWIKPFRIRLWNMHVRYAGDINGDGTVDFSDFVVFAENFTGSLPTGTGDKAFEHGDFDGDADVDFRDFVQLADNWTETGSYAPSTTDGGMRQTDTEIDPRI